MTTDLLGGWGGDATELSLNWALGQGYTYALFMSKLVPPEMPAVWSNPRAVRLLLERGEEACAFAFYLDGDAVATRANSSLEQTIQRLLPAGGPVFVFPCHSPFAERGDGTTCHVGGACRCGRATSGCGARELAAMTHRKVTGAKHVPWCLINSGAYLVRNTAAAREMMGWWADLRACPPGEIGRGGAQLRLEPDTLQAPSASSLCLVLCFVLCLVLLTWSSGHRIASEQRPSKLVRSR